MTCLQESSDDAGGRFSGALSLKPQKQQEKIWIIDTFPFNGEMVVELRLKHLHKDVDEIIVVESRVTHSGKKKDFLFVERDKSLFAPYLDKVSVCKHVSGAIAVK